MEFISTSPFEWEDEEKIWSFLREAFEESEPGYCWHNHPITGINGSHTALPDVIILHPIWGLIVIEIKGCELSQIESIQGYTWYMSDSWYKREIEPVYQATKHMWTIIDRMKDFRHSALRDEKGDCKVAGKAFVCLPDIAEPEWLLRFKDHISVAPKDIIFSTDLTADLLKQKLENAFPKQNELSDQDWNIALALIKNSEPIQSKPRRPAQRTNSRADLLRQVEQQMAAFDIHQHRFAIQTPWGPQQLTGLAGTGKTVVLAQKAAYMHIKYPDWKIVYTFYSRTLHGQIERLIQRFVQEFSRGELKEPNWENIHVWHSWGTRQSTGLYRELCNITGQHFMGYTEASRYFGIKNSNKVFELCCKELLTDAEIPELYDAILIDEGQDFDSHY